MNTASSSTNTAVVHGITESKISTTVPPAPTESFTLEVVGDFILASLERDVEFT